MFRALGITGNTDTHILGLPPGKISGLYQFSIQSVSEMLIAQKVLEFRLYPLEMHWHLIGILWKPWYMWNRSCYFSQPFITFPHVYSYFKLMWRSWPIYHSILLYTTILWNERTWFLCCCGFYDVVSFSSIRKYNYTINEGDPSDRHAYLSWLTLWFYGHKLPQANLILPHISQCFFLGYISYITS